jgi:predicted AlkP superfamily phosphohydrolase/phosphomutase
MKRVVIIGLDGVPYELLKDFTEREIMPNTKQLISKGTFRKMQSSIPEVSSVAWSSIITGKNPAEHGIFGFTDFPANTYRLSFPNFSCLKAVPFWESDVKNRHIIINVPSTYPARKLNGVLISGFVAPNFEKAVYPDSMVPSLKNMDYKIDADSDKARQSLELFLRDLNRTNEARISVYKYLWNQDWKTFMLVFTGTDRLMHFLWDAYEDKSHSFKREFEDYFRKIDEVIGEIISKIDDQDDFIMLSDHGFEKLECDVCVNYVLKKNGFLKLTDGNAVGYRNIDCDSKAFALDPARIYVNLKGKYPRGGVSCREREGVIEDLEQLFKGLEINHKKVIRNIYRKEEIYKGPYFDQAPDIILVGNKGFNLKAAVNSGSLCSKDILTGKHTQDNAFFLVSEKCEKGIIPENLNVCDVVGVINQLKECHK